MIPAYRKPRVYLAGPMRGIACLNFPVFNDMAQCLRMSGLDVISPAEMDIEACEPWTDKQRPNWANEKYPFSAHDCKRLVERDIKVIMSLDPQHNDALYLLPKWNNSVGADAERGIARWCLINVWELVQSKLNPISWDLQILHPSPYIPVPTLNGLVGSYSGD